jgi:hypothetical protein
MEMRPEHARWLFRGAAVYGLIMLLPFFFAEKAAAAPAALLDHPEFYYGFLGAASAWQLVYWTIGADPVRYRAFMPLGVIAKYGFWIPVTYLWLNGRTPTSTFILSNGDFLLGAAFLFAWRTLKTPA